MFPAPSHREREEEEKEREKRKGGGIMIIIEIYNNYILILSKPTNSLPLIIPTHMRIEK